MIRYDDRKYFITLTLFDMYTCMLVMNHDISGSRCNDVVNFIYIKALQDYGIVQLLDNDEDQKVTLLTICCL